jgi:phosphoribosylglycinamide formyltransferase-1
MGIEKRVRNIRNIAIFASGNGTNFEVLASKFPDNVQFVFTDHHDAYVLQRAERLDVPAYAFNPKEFENKAEYEARLVDLLDENAVDLVCLAGYMRIIGPTLLAHYQRRIINIHPSLLPDFAGSPHAIEESWNAHRGLGVTVHYVDEGVDTGEVIAQQPCKYLPSLVDYEASLHQIEYQLYPKVVQQLMEE